MKLFILIMCLSSSISYAFEGFTVVEYSSKNDSLLFIEVVNKDKRIYKKFHIEGQNYFYQNNYQLLIANYSEQYNQKQYFFDFDRRVSFTRNLNMSDFHNAVSSNDNYFAVELSNLQAEESIGVRKCCPSGRVFQIMNNFENYFVRYCDGNIHVFNSNGKNVFIDSDLYIVFLEELYSNQKKDEVNLVMRVLDVNNRTTKQIWSIVQNDRGDKNGWFLGYFYYQNPKTCLISFNKFISDYIVVSLYGYCDSISDFVCYREFSIPRMGNSISNIIFRELTNGNILVTDNRYVYLISEDNSCELLYETDLGSKIVYLNSVEKQ